MEPVIDQRHYIAKAARRRRKRMIERAKVYVLDQGEQEEVNLGGEIEALQELLALALPHVDSAGDVTLSASIRRHFDRLERDGA